jgi:tellurite resistance protein
MAALVSVELTADCDACGLEGGVVEVYDALVAACRFGLPTTTRCKLCTAESRGTFDRAHAKALREIPANRCPACLHELGPSAVDERRCPTCHARAALEDTKPPISFETVADLERALDAWAERERFPSRQALVAATFVEPDIAKIFAALQRKEPLEVLADPFANMGIRTTGRNESRRREPRQRDDGAPSAGSSNEPRARAELAAPAPHEAVGIVPPHRAPEPNPLARTSPDPAYAQTAPLAPPLTPPPSAPPRAIVFPLVSVIAADGEIHPEERALVDRFLAGEGLAPLADHEFSVHHPSAVAHFVPRERREDVVKLMCETAAIDGMPDESEHRVIRAYATAWNVDDEKLEFWMWGYETMNTSLARQLFLKLRRFVLSARWGESDTKE